MFCFFCRCEYINIPMPVRCQCKTLRGTRYSRRAKEDTGFCFQHTFCSDREAVSEASDDEGDELLRRRLDEIDDALESCRAENEELIALRDEAISVLRKGS